MHHMDEAIGILWMGPFASYSIGIQWIAQMDGIILWHFIAMLTSH